MTIKMGSLEDKSIVDQKFKLRVIGIGHNDKVIAVKVRPDGIKSEKETPHITIAVNKALGGSPKDANDIIKWRAVGKSFYLQGRVKEISEKL